MKKAFLFIVIIAACGLAFAGFRAFNAAAQITDENLGKSGVGLIDIEKDRALAAEIRQLTNRSLDGLSGRKTRGGGFGVDLQGRFQTVMLSRIDADGENVVACVTSLAEANAFFGRDLETGANLSGYQAQFRPDAAASVAARHGMSPQEYEFYRNMIENSTARSQSAPSNSTITIINQDGANEGFNDPAPATPEGGNPGTRLGDQRLNVFREGARIWSEYLDSSVPIVVNGNFDDDLFCDPTGATLGSAGPNGANFGFPNSPFPDTFYYAALANKISRTDLNGAAPEINSRYNSKINNTPGCDNGSRFYYGYDSVLPPNTIDLLIVVLHEFGHGLGFGGLVNPNTGELGKDGNGNPHPDIYTRMMFDRSIGKYWHLMTDAERQTSKLNNGNVLWDGANVKIASGFLTAGRETSTGRVQLFTPATLQPGSSIVHFDTAVAPNLLMEPAINPGLPTTLDLTRQQMRDIGWFRDTNTADTIRDAVTDVAPNSGTANIGSTRNITWTNVSGFNKNVAIELSTDGGATYPNVIAASAPNTGSYSWTVPNMPTTQARVRVREVDYADPSGASSADFAIAAAPTAANVAVFGRVVDAAGRSVAGARVAAVGADTTSYALTNAFGFYRFDELAAGATYVFQIKHKRHTFPAQVINVNEDTADLNFVSSN